MMAEKRKRVSVQPVMKTTRDELLTLAEVGALLKLTPAAVRHLVYKGEIPGVKLGGSWRFRRSAIDALIAGLPSLNPYHDNHMESDMWLETRERKAF